MRRHKQRRKAKKLVCAKCGSDYRQPRAQYDNEGRPFLTWTVCAYCGRSELSLDGKKDEPQGKVWDIDAA